MSWAPMSWFGWPRTGIALAVTYQLRLQYWAWRLRHLDRQISSGKQGRQISSGKQGRQISSGEQGPAL